MEVKVKAVGISASPRLNGNSEMMVKEALRGAFEQGDVETELVRLAEKKITSCNWCGKCFEGGTCPFDDDFADLYQRMLDADLIIIGSPVFVGDVPSICRALIERCYSRQVRADVARSKPPLGLKIGGTIVIGRGRHEGQETAIEGIQQFFIRNEMLPVGINSPDGQAAVTGVAFGPGEVADDKWFLMGRPNVPIDNLEAAWMYGRKLSIAAKIVKAGIKASGLDLMYIDGYAGVLKSKYPQSVKIFGVSGSPRKNKANTSMLIREALDGAAEVEGVTTDYFSIAGKDIALCRNCGACYLTYKCVIKDGAEEYVEKCVDNDGMVLGAPCYNLNPGPILPLLSRYYPLTAKHVLDMKPDLPWKLKPIGHIVNGSSRHGGQEASIQNLCNMEASRGAFATGMMAPFHELGLVTLAGRAGQIIQDIWYEPALGRKVSSLELARIFGKKIALVSHIVKAGRNLTGLDYVDVALGRNMKGGPYPATICKDRAFDGTDK